MVQSTIIVQSQVMATCDIWLEDFLEFERKKDGSNTTFTFKNISASALLEKAEIVEMTSVKQFGLQFPECS